MHYYAINQGGQELSHFGILGMKWGVRRYQNPDGSLTAAGKARYEKKVSPQTRAKHEELGETLYMKHHGNVQKAKDDVHTVVETANKSLRKSIRRSQAGIIPASAIIGAGIGAALPSITALEAAGISAISSLVNTEMKYRKMLNNNRGIEAGAIQWLDSVISSETIDPNGPLPITIISRKK